MRRVLVIDDEADVRLLYRVNLRHAGFEVLEAGDGEQGIEAALEHLPDAVVLDLMMPQIDGFEVLRALRAHPDSSEVPVLVLTADARSDDHRRCYELGADDVITKPFVPEALTEGLATMLGASHEERIARRVQAAQAHRAG
jgi:DNA-binding response OmpR family regulator